MPRNPRIEHVGGVYRQKLLESLNGKFGGRHSGQLKRETAEANVVLIIREELKARPWMEKVLEERAKGDLEKLAVEARLRREATLTIPAIAARLNLGSWKSFAAKLHRWNKPIKTWGNFSLTPI
jgi:hypothetical protein